MHTLLENADNVHYVKLVIERPSPTVPEGCCPVSVKLTHSVDLTYPLVVSVARHKRLLRVGCDGEHAAERGCPLQGFHALRMKRAQRRVVAGGKRDGLF